MNDALDAAAPQAPVFSALMVQAAAGAQLSPAQQHFNRLLQQVSTLSEQITRLEAWEARQRHAHVQALYQSRQQAQALSEALQLQLHEHLQSGLLGSSQQRIARRKLRQLQGKWPSAVPQVQALVALYRDEGEDEEAAEQARAAAQRLREQIEQALGQPLDGGKRHQTPEEVMAAGMRQWQRQQDAADARKAAKRAARKAQKKPQVQAQQLDAKSALRTVFRQLASALHPDREPDASERARKTVLMSAVNAAYEKGDLSTLLRLQLQTLSTGAVHKALADERLAAMALLLKDQIKALQDDWQHLCSRLSQELGVAVGAEPDEAAMDRQLRQQRQQAEQQVAQFEADLRSVGSDAALKSWLKAQGVAMKETASGVASLWV